MKIKSSKNRIIIPDLIKKLKTTDTDKENKCTNLPSQTKMKISHFLDQSESMLKQEIEAPTNQSTCRVSEPESINEESEIRSMLVSETRKNKLDKLEFSRMQELLRSEKMFINPDKWSEFMERSMNDPQFHKALNGFLYNYFIQNYN